MDTKWQWLTQSPTRMVGLILLVLAVVLLLTLMVLVSSKSTKKKVEISIPQASPTILPTLLPDPTQNWLTLTNTNGYKVKYPSEAVITTSFNKEASRAASVRIVTNPSEKIPNLQNAVGIEVMHKDTGGSIPGLGNSLKEVTDKQFLSDQSPNTTKAITKPIEILIAGNQGYEYYLEKYPQGKPVKVRVIIFEYKNKYFIITATLDTQTELVLNTLILTSY